ncbi:MAG: hypothetical protein KF724_00885 [Phycisphaeraceae bacterium]|nr:hypothetical protein [Phycisphaeraceae bacterium]
MSDAVIERAHAFLRAHLSGRIRFDDNAIAIKVVVAPDGRLVAPVMVAMLESIETVLEMPDDDEASLHLMVSLVAFDEQGEHGALADRWRIYHGDPPDVRWAIMTIDAARFEGHFIDGEALLIPNPMATHEAAILRRLNQGDRTLLKRACEAANLTAGQPVAVGIDDRGLDVRRAFDVVRVPFPEPLSGISGDAVASVTESVERALASS